MSAGVSKGVQGKASLEMRFFARMILRAERQGGSDAEKMSRLRNLIACSAMEGSFLPARWVMSGQEEFSWEDNLLALAEKVLGLPTKPWEPGAALEEWQRKADACLQG